ncbi:Vacuolar protein sorting-associated protein 16 [Cichlidogyrus casuarinus]|uniref:Vacuolar protein sorting-associated protein 16 homolog n=1 Tax=Cichlidogyrus casuarinus TaxID=1844966 RepID=A0ABD2QJ36_9PLAT
MKQFASNWINLEDDPAHYRMLDLYDMPWGKNYSLVQYPISISPITGCICMLITSKSSKPILQLYEASGKPLLNVAWKDSPPIKIGWSLQEELILIQANGHLAILNLRGEIQKRISMGVEAIERGIIDARIFMIEKRTGAAVMTNGFHIYLTTSLDEPKVRLLPDIPNLKQFPDGWNIIPSFNRDEFPAKALVSFDRNLALASIGVHNIVTVPPAATKARAVHFEVSHNQKIVAIYFDNGLLWLSDLSLEQPTKNLIDLCKQTNAILDDKSQLYPVLSLKWISASALLVHWTNVIAIVNCMGGTHELFVPMGIHLEQELDGVRILSPTHHKFIQRVPRHLEMIGQIGPPTSAKLLTSMSESLELKTGHANDFLEKIKTAAILFEAIDDCLNAASQEAICEIAVAQQLLRAAKTGICFLSIMIATGQQGPGPSVKQCQIDQEIHKLTYFCQMLRFLNSLAAPFIGLKLTWRQYQTLGPAALLDRLLSRSYYPLCLNLVKISSDLHQLETLKCPQSSSSGQMLALPIKNGINNILTHWACNALDAKNEEQIKSKVNSIIGLISCTLLESSVSLGPEKLQTSTAKSIDKSLQSKIRELSFAEVAMQALKAGKKEIAEQLLQFECNFSKVVPVLLSLEQYSRALARAVESGDPELIVSVIVRLRDEKKVSAAELMVALRKYPTALAIYMETCAASDPNLSDSLISGNSLESSLQNQVANPSLQTKNLAKNAYKENNYDAKMRALQKLQEYYTLLKNDFMIHECECQLRLLKLQKELEAKHVSAPTYVFQYNVVEDNLNVTCESAGSRKKHKLLPQMIASSSVDWIGQSAHETILRLLIINMERQTEKMRTDQRIADRHFRVLKYIALGLQYQKADPASAQNSEIFAEVERCLRLKKPELGLEALVHVLRDISRSDLASKLIEKLPEEKRVKLFVLIGYVLNLFDVC